MNEDVKSENLRIHSRADELIACLEGEIAKRDEELAACRVAVENCDVFRVRIADLEEKLAADDDANFNLRGLLQRGAFALGLDPENTSWFEVIGELEKQSAGFAAIKAQEPVARLPACPSRAFAVANLRDLAQSVLQHDPDVGMFRDEDQAFLINELADLAESFNGDVKLYAAPVSEAKAQGVVLDGSQLAGLLEQVRLNDDEAKPHGSGATYWNNAVIACQVAIRDALAAPVQQVSVPDEMRSLAQRLREYNQNPHHINPMSEAFHILVVDAANAISTACVPKEIAAAITWSEHLLFECGALTSTRAPSVHVYNKTFAAVNEARAMLNAAPAAPAADAGLEGLLRSCLPALSDGGCAALANRIDAALSAGKEGE